MLVFTGLHIIVLTESLYLQQSNSMFSESHKIPRRLQRQVSFSGVASKLLDAKSGPSRKLSREITKMARVQEEKERQQMREKEVAEEKKKKKKEDEFDRSVITRRLSIFGSYRRMSLRVKQTMSEEVSNGLTSDYPPGELGGFNGPISFLFLLVMEPYKELFVFSLATEYFFMIGLEL